MASTKLDAFDSTVRPAYSCIRCATRKVKCDREYPCSQCSRHNAQCTYKQYLAPPKRHSRAKYDRLNEQLRRYEGLLREHGLNPSTDSPTPNDTIRPQTVDRHASAATNPESQMQTPASTVSGPGLSASKTQVLQIEGHSRFVDKCVILMRCYIPC